MDLNDDLTKADIHGHAVGRLPSVGETISTDEQSSDLFGNAWFDHVEVLVVPTGRLADDFFDLATGYAGQIVRKAVNYGICLVVMGDIESYIQQSNAFADFVREANQGEHIWFLPDDEALGARLTPHS